MAYDKIDFNECYYTVGMCTPKQIEKILSVLLNKKNNFKKKYDFLLKIIKENGYSLADIITSLHEDIVNNKKNIKKLSNNQIIFLLDSMSNIEDKLNYSTFEEIYIGALISSFSLLKDYT